MRNGYRATTSAKQSRSVEASEVRKWAVSQQPDNRRTGGIPSERPGESSDVVVIGVPLSPALFSEQVAVHFAGHFIGHTSYESRMIDHVLLGKFLNWSGEEAFQRAIFVAAEEEAPGLVERAAVALGRRGIPFETDFLAEMVQPSIHDRRLVSVATSRVIIELAPSYDDDDG